MDYNLLKILFVILCFQSLFISFFLFQSKKGNLLSNKILALVFLLFSVSIISLSWMALGIITSFPQLLFIDDSFMFAYGPLLYLFTQSILFKKYQLRRNHIVHFIPFLIFFIILIIMLFYLDIETLSQAMSQVENKKIPFYIRIGELLMLTHIFYYLFRSKREINNVLNQAFQTHSSINQDNVKSLKFIINCFIVLFLISLVHSFLPFIGFKNGLLVTLLLMVLFMFYFINSILLKMLNTATNNGGLITQANHEAKEKYGATKLSVVQLNTYKSDLAEYMKTHKKYLNSELKIDDLASELDIPSKVLSQIINEGYSCNFFDYINQFRVEEAKSLFSNTTDEKMTIQEVMYDSGFNSKSSFNTAFKKFTHLTPSQFRTNLEKGSTS